MNEIGLKQNKTMRKYISSTINITLWILFVWGLCILWKESPSMILSYFATAFGITGMIWVTITIYEKINKV